MFGAVAGLGVQLRDGYEGARARLDLVPWGGGGSSALPVRPNGVAVLGMGGSAIGADLVLAATPHLPVPATVVRGYDLPAWLGRDTLVIAVSYSGETEETLTAVAAALERGCVPLCVTSGGRLAAVASERGLPLVAAPDGLQPRAALGHLAMPILAALVRAHLVPEMSRDVDEAVALLDDAARDFAPAVADDLNLAKGVARRLHRRVALVYGAGRTVPVARRWKTQLNENAKAAAFFAELPELDHNEIEGWGADTGLAERSHVVFLEDARGDARLRRRCALTARALAGAGVSVERLETRGVSPLACVFSLVALGDHASLYVAALEGIDPTPVDEIGRLKRALAGSGPQS